VIKEQLEAARTQAGKDRAAAKVEADHYAARVAAYDTIIAVLESELRTLPVLAGETAAEHG
jgi:hypothetical protein